MKDLLDEISQEIKSRYPSSLETPKNNGVSFRLPIASRIKWIDLHPRRGYLRIDMSVPQDKLDDPKYWTEHTTRSRKERRQSTIQYYPKDSRKYLFDLIDQAFNIRMREYNKR